MFDLIPGCVAQPFPDCLLLRCYACKVLFVLGCLAPSQLPQMVLSWPIGFFVCLFLMSALSFSLMIALQGRLAIAWPVPFNSVEGPSVP